jgi:glycosyltransferase involved in cell wall biosynthesis
VAGCRRRIKTLFIQVNGLEQAIDSGALAAQSAAAHRRIKVVFLIRVLGVGGAERQLVELAKALDRRTFEIVVLCFYEGGAFAKDLLAAGIPVISLHKRGRWEVLRFAARMALELRRLRPDIVHAYLTGPNLMAAVMKPILGSTRIVWGIRASRLETEDRLEKVLSRLEVLLSSRASLVIVNSAAGLAYCHWAGFAKDHCVVIRNGIDVTRFSPDNAARVEQRSAWGIPPDALVIGLVGRIDPMKDHATFLRAAAIFAESRPDARFVCIGGGPFSYVSQLQALARQLGIEEKVVWTGIAGDMPAAYRALDICCSSSAFGEGTPNCVAEAMACGVPCVVTDVGDSRIVVGQTGAVVPPANPAALAAALGAMAQRIAREPHLGWAARERIVAGFSLRRLADETTKALRALV